MSPFEMRKIPFPKTNKKHINIAFSVPNSFTIIAIFLVDLSKVKRIVRIFLFHNTSLVILCLSIFDVLINENIFEFFVFLLKLLNWSSYEILLLLLLLL